MADTNYISRADILNEDVLAPMVENSYQDAMVFMPLADIDRTLENNPGDTLKVPTWKGKLTAEKVEEGADIPLGKLTQGYTTATVQKFGVGTSFSDESNLVSLANNAEKGTREVGNAIAQYSDTALMTAALELKDKTDDDGAKPYSLDTTFDINGLYEMMDHFVSQDNQVAYTIIGNPKDKTKFRRAVIEYLKGTDVGANIALSGATTLIDGASFYSTNKMTEGQLVVVYSSQNDIEAAKELSAKLKEGNVSDKELETLNTGRPFKWLVKRDTMVEVDRKKSNQVNYIYGTKIAAPYVQNPSKLLVVNAKKA